MATPRLSGVPDAPIIDQILRHGVIAILDAPSEHLVVPWGLAIAKGGLEIVALPVSLEKITELVDDLADEAEIRVGVAGVIDKKQISIAVAAAAEFIVSPIADPEIISIAKQHGFMVIASGATPTEIATAYRAGADLVTYHPAGAMKPAHFDIISSIFPEDPLLVSGGIDVENAPDFLEAGAAAAIVDQGLFPNTAEASAQQVITMRAVGLAEVCADARGVEKLSSFRDLLRPNE